LAGVLELEPEPLEAPEPEGEAGAEPEPDPEPEPEVGPEAGAVVAVFVVVLPLVVVAPFVDVLVEVAAFVDVVFTVVTEVEVAASVVLVVPAPPVAVTACPTALPVCVGLSPVYAYTGSIKAGVTGETRLEARPLSGTTGLLPGRVARVPVVVSSMAFVRRQFPPCWKVKIPASEQQVGSPNSLQWHLSTTFCKTPAFQPIMKSAWYPYPVGSPIAYTNGWAGFIAWLR
jgi:hypothetical protein